MDDFIMNFSRKLMLTPLDNICLYSMYDSFPEIINTFTDQYIKRDCWSDVKEILTYKNDQGRLVLRVCHCDAKCDIKKGNLIPVWGIF